MYDMTEEYNQALRFSRNIELYDETPIATTEEELLMAINMIKKRRALVYQVGTGGNKNSDVRKIY